MTETETESSRVRPEIDLLGMLRRRWQHLAFGTVVGLVLATVYWQVTPRMYESSIEVLVGQRSSEATNRGTMSEGNGNDSFNGDQLATHMRLFVAKKVLAKAIENGSLNSLESFKTAQANGESLFDHILDNIEVERGGEGSAEDAMVLRASYRATDPADAASVLAAIFNSYKSYIDTQGQDSSNQAVELIEAARRTHEQELTDADLEYRTYVSSVPVLIEGDKVRDIHKERLADMEAELNLVRSSLAESSSRLQVIESALDTDHGQKISDIDHLALLSQKEVERLKFFLEMTRGGSQSESFQAQQPMRQEVAKTHYNRLLDLIQKERALSDTFGTEHPLVESARKEIEITRSFLAEHTPDAVENASKDLDPSEMLATYVMLLRNDISEFEKRRAMLLEESEKELLLAKKVESDFMKGNALRAKLERAQARYNQVIVRLQELNLARSYAGFSTDVLASPEEARSPVWPNAIIVLALGCCGGFAFGLVLTLVAETLDSTFSNVADLEKAIGSPVIAHMPRISPSQLRRQADRKSLLDPSLVAFHMPRSAEAEIYRVARTSLMIANRKGAVQTMMMTSAQPGDGKSTTICNLAISLAQTGKKVLLIDADMRRPVVSKLFGIDRRPGLSDYLCGSDFASTVTTSEVDGLDLMVNGGTTGEPAELLESYRLRNLIQDACAEYDIVLFDAPPLLAVADPAIIAPYVDSVLLTVRVIKNGRHAVEDAVRILDDIQIVPSAVMVNGVDKKVRSSYGYGGYTRKGYGYVGHYHKKYSANEGDESMTRAASGRRVTREREAVAAHGATQTTKAPAVPAPAAGPGRMHRYESQDTTTTTS